MRCGKEVQFLGYSWSENSSLSVKVTLLNHRGSFRRNSHGGEGRRLHLDTLSTGIILYNQWRPSCSKQDILLCELGDLKPRQLKHIRHSLSLSVSQYCPV